MPCKRVNITLPADLLALLDEYLAAGRMTRSMFIREAIELKLSLESYVDQEFIGSYSMPNIIRRLHFEKTIKRSLPSVNSLSYSKTQD